jgi:uncharacterized membrane protein
VWSVVRSRKNARLHRITRRWTPDIVAFHALTGLGMIVVIAGLELYLAWQYRGAYRSLFTTRAKAG